MPKRKPSKSSLYELIKTRRGPMVDEAPDDVGEEDAPTRSLGGQWLSPGRTVTVPVGYVLLTVALVIAGVVAAYIYGYGRARQFERDRFEQQLLARAGELDDVSRPRDPLLDLEQPGGGSGSDAGNQGERTTGSEPWAGSGWGEIDDDPRLQGHSYYVVMTTHREGAIRLTRFCRENQLETYVVPRKNRDNDNQYFVIAMPGFPPGTSNQAPECLETRRRIQAIGTLWKSQGELSDLHDTYLMTFDP